jgi:hypothetical protein
MPKKPDPAPIVYQPEDPPPVPERVLVGGTETGLPQGLHLNGQFYATRLSDGRLVVEGLPDSLMARYYPDLFPPALPVAADPVADLPPPPTITEV